MNITDKLFNFYFDWILMLPSKTVENCHKIIRVFANIFLIAWIPFAIIVSIPYLLVLCVAALIIEA